MIMRPHHPILISVFVGIFMVSVGSVEKRTTSDEDKATDDASILADTTQEDFFDFQNINVEGPSLTYGENEAAEEFVPTEEWQRIKPGQSIPSGLHVRMNLQTGEKEAKLLSENEVQGSSEKASDPPEYKQNTALIPQENEQAAEPAGHEGKESDVEPGRLLRMKQAMEEAVAELEQQQSSEDVAAKGPTYWKDGEKEGMMNMKKDTFSREELKEALKKFKASDDDVKQKREEDLRKNFRSIEELKKNLKDMNMDMKTDNEILRDLFNKYQKNDKLDERKLILTDLEYYLHQIDNAKDFANMGGLNLVIKDLNHTDESIRSEAAFVLGSATQSNPKVQIQAIEGGSLQQLIRMLPAPASAQLRSRVLYAISSTVRQFPHAQKRLLELGGLAAMTVSFQQDDTQHVRLKVLTLITDLVVEQKHAAAIDDTTADSAQVQRKQQYKEVPLIRSLQEQGWCELIPTMLEVPEHDSREKVLVCIRTLMDYCKPSFYQSLPKLSKYREEYENLSKTEINESPDEQYYTGVLQLVDTLISNLRIKEEL